VRGGRRRAQAASCAPSTAQRRWACAQPLAAPRRAGGREGLLARRGARPAAAAHSSACPPCSVCASPSPPSRAFLRYLNSHIYTQRSRDASPRSGSVRADGVAGWRAVGRAGWLSVRRSGAPQTLRVPAVCAGHALRRRFGRAGCAAGAPACALAGSWLCLRSLPARRRRSMDPAPCWRVVRRVCAPNPSQAFNARAVAVGCLRVPAAFLAGEAVGRSDGRSGGTGPGRHGTPTRRRAGPRRSGAGPGQDGAARGRAKTERRGADALRQPERLT
jgi:hypothetical protein